MLQRQQDKMTIPATLNAFATLGNGNTFLDVGADSCVGVFITATHTNVLNVLAVCDDGTRYQLRNAAGTAITIAATAGSGLYALILDTTTPVQKIAFQVAAGTEAAVRTIYAVTQQVN